MTQPRSRSGRTLDVDGLAPASRLVDRLAAGTLLAVAAFLVVGLHLGSYLDALRSEPTRVEYVSSPSAFWIVKHRPGPR
ncbi:MAG: hypothetical protein GEV07_11785 [Streptosporangiales bacterium]|nr:hypothetical protein [Streptosporangiales bacterium]